jgi:FtsX-like permease family/MacB-like periplasmic core domain
MGVARFRLRSTFRRRVGGLVALVVLVGLLGGLGLGSVAAARRTQSSFSNFLASTNASDLLVTMYGNGVTGVTEHELSTLSREMARLPEVQHVVAGFVVTGAPLDSTGAPRLRVAGLAYPVASTDGLFVSQDRLGVTQGRAANPRRADEIVMAPILARLLHYHVGQAITFGFYSGTETASPGFGTAAVRPIIRMRMKLVGLASLNSEIVEDDVDVLPTFIPLTPAFARQALTEASPYGGTTFGFKTRGGVAAVPAVEREVGRLIPPGLVYTFHALSPVSAKADRSLKPISIAFAIFGAIALVAAVMIAVQLMARRLRTDRDERMVLRALGATPLDTVLDGLIGLFGAIVAGAVLAVAVAVALSPVAPLGPVRSVDPSRGLSWDWTVLGLGLVALVVVLGACAVLLAWASAPHRVALRPRIRASSGARVVAAMARSGLSAPGVVGARMALEPGEGGAAVPVRSALLGTVLAVALVVTTLTFGNSLQTLVSNPPLYGWNWTYMLNPVGSGGGDVPQVALKMLAHDKYVSGYAGASYNNLELDGQGVPFLIESDKADVAPPILTGHGVEGPRQVVLGAATLSELHKRVGQFVTAAYGSPADGSLYIPPTRLRVVGTATFPAVGFASTVSDHTSMGTGVLLPFQVLPHAFVAAIDGGPTPALAGPNLALVRIKPGAPPGAARSSLERIAAAADRAFASAPGGSAGNAIVVQGVQRPAEIVNYKTIGVTPALLALALVLGSIAALVLTLFASVRQRRRDLALLKTIGFVRRQLAATVAWQATVVAVVGIAVGIPLGIVAGRWLWDLFAEQIYAVPYPTVSVVSVVLVGVISVLLANVVAAFPARTAARTPTALMLRAE